MKNIKRYIGFVAIVALLFTSCTKDENNLPNNSDTELATLSFAPLLANLDNARAALKQQEDDIPNCSDTDPAYVQIILSNAEGDVVGSMGAPFSIDLVNGQLFTEEVPDLELPPGVYSLDHFAVYNAADVLIWLAPKTGGDFANWVDNPLPLEINLGAGVKKYVDVTVLCFDDRDVNEYGYLFFELNPEVALEFCFFANYCDDDGRHYPASYNVSIWKGTDNTGDLLYSDIPNVTGQYPAPDDDYFATPLCFALPPNDDMAEQYLYYEVTLLDWPDVYGTVSEPDITGTLSMNDIIANLNGDDEVEYEHLRFNCEDGNGNGECDLQDPEQDCDQDGVPNGVDQCPTDPGTVANNGCPEQTCDLEDPNQDCDEDGVLNGDDECPAVPGTVANNGCPEQGCDLQDPNQDCDEDGVLNGVDDCPSVPGTVANNGCPEQGCDLQDPNQDCDEDGVLNGVDDCPSVPGTVANNGCPDESCLPDPAEGCERFADTYNIDSNFEIIQIQIGDLTVEITEAGLEIGLTPIAPFEITDIEVTIGDLIVCVEGVVPAEGGSVTIGNIGESDLPFDLGLRVNYCDVSQ